MDIQPPANPILRRLWAMGFDESQRTAIVEAASREPLWDVISLGSFLASHAAIDCVGCCERISKGITMRIAKYWQGHHLGWRR